jgi:hypothetical protein
MNMGDIDHILERERASDGEQTSREVYGFLKKTTDLSSKPEKIALQHPKPVLLASA